MQGNLLTIYPIGYKKVLVMEMNQIAKWSKSAGMLSAF